MHHLRNGEWLPLWAVSRKEKSCHQWLKCLFVRVLHWAPTAHQGCGLLIHKETLIIFGFCFSHQHLFKINLMHGNTDKISHVPIVHRVLWAYHAFQILLQFLDHQFDHQVLLNLFLECTTCLQSRRTKWYWLSIPHGNIKSPSTPYFRFINGMYMPFQT